MACILMTLFTINVFAYNQEIGKCNTSDPVCVELQKEYGSNSTVLYSTVATATCTNEIQININGELRTIYVSEKPKTGTTGGIIPDSGIVGGIDSSTGMPTVSLPQTSIPSDNLLNSNNIVDNPTTAVDEIAIHNKLIEIFGNKANIYWNTVSTSRCKYASSVQVNGVQVTVYLSQKPSTGEVNVQMGSDGKLVIDGISSDDNIVNQITYSIKKQTVGYPYNEINEKLIYIFGSNQDVRYFIEDDIEGVKAILANKNKNYDEIMSDFHAINIGIETGVKKVYVNKELTPDQKALLNADLNSEALVNNKQTETNSSIVQILLIISLIINVVLVCGIVFTNKKSKRTNNESVYL